MDLLHSIHDKLDRIIQLLERQGKETMSALTDLQTAVTAIKTADASALALVQGLAQQVTALSAQLASQGVDTAAIDALASDLNTEAANLASAIVANTPSAPVVTPPTTPATP